MTREEAINEYIVPAISRTWNDDRCKEILEALDQEPCTVTEFADRCMECGKILGDMIKPYVKLHNPTDKTWLTDVSDALKRNGIIAEEQEPCTDAISREAVLDLVVANHTELNGVNVVMYTPFYKDITQLPSVTPTKNVGKWIMHIDDLFPVESTMECNKCHEHQPITIDDNYCPNCGAKMQEVES